MPSVAPKEWLLRKLSKIGKFKNNNTKFWNHKTLQFPKVIIFWITLTKNFHLKNIFSEQNRQSNAQCGREAMVTMIRNFCNGSSGINWRRLLVACESCIDDANHQWLLLLFFISVLMHLPTTTLAPSAPNDYVVLYSYLAHSRGKQGVYCTMTY